MIRMVEWALMLPSFNEILVEDQARLIRFGLFIFLPIFFFFFSSYDLE